MDDDPLFTHAVEYLLSYEFPDVRIVVFNNPEQALNRIYDDKPDILFLDLNMPKINGWQFLEKISKKPLASHIYILSSSVNPNDIRKANGYHFVQDFISKPLTKTFLNKLLSSSAN